MLASYAASVPLRQDSDLTAAALRVRILDLTQGVLVRVARFLETLAVDAIRSGRERIEANDLDATPAVAPLLSIPCTNARRRGSLPVRTSRRTSEAAASQQCYLKAFLNDLKCSALAGCPSR